MMPRVPGSPPPAAVPAGDPQRPGPSGPQPVQPAAAPSGFDKLKRRLATCLPICGRPGDAEAPPAVLRPR
jgi:hypothetical protein